MQPETKDASTQTTFKVSIRIMAADNVHFCLTANSTLVYLQQTEADTNVKADEETDKPRQL